ncbi:MAG: hypothetical protein ACE5HC_16875 [Candidatus Binatia bacterium]
MTVITKQALRIGCLVAIIAITLQAPIRAAAHPHPNNGEGKIEFRRAEYANTQTPKIAHFITKEFRGVPYRVAKRPDLKFMKADLTEVIVQETEPGDFGLHLVVDRSLWTAIESITTASLGNELGILVDGSLVFVGVVREPLRNGRLLISFGRNTKKQAFDLAHRLSSKPTFMPFEVKKGK